MTIAAGGNGHAFKMLPVLGDIILSAVEGRMPEDQKANFAIKERPALNIEKTAKDQRRPLVLEELVRPEDLLA